MSHFYGTLQGNRGEASRCGSKNSGITTHAAGWQGAIRVSVWHEGGEDHYSVSLVSWGCASGRSRHIATGVLDVTQDITTLQYLIKPLEDFVNRLEHVK